MRVLTVQETLLPESGDCEAESNNENESDGEECLEPLGDVELYTDERDNSDESQESLLDDEIRSAPKMGRKHNLFSNKLLII